MEVEMRRIMMLSAACLLLVAVMACESKKAPVTEKGKELQAEHEEMDGLVQE
jgi:hypothetical protein